VYEHFAYTLSIVEAVTPEPLPLLGYQLRLPTFEGPLDVLLRLIERNQLPITDVSLMAVTEQFLAYVEQLGGAPPHVLAEFAAVGARLVLLKSRSLLPRPPATEEEPETGDLARQLIEYQAVKRVAQQLAERDQAGTGAFARSLGAIAAPAPVERPRLAAHEASWLAKALRRRLAALPSPRQIVAARPLVSLATMIERVLRTLSGKSEVLFSRVAEECQDNHEVRTAFLAVLVLIRRRILDAEQAEPFSEIRLRRRPAAWRGVIGPVAIAPGDDSWS